MNLITIEKLMSYDLLSGWSVFTLSSVAVVSEKKVFYK